MWAAKRLLPLEVQVNPVLKAAYLAGTIADIYGQPYQRASYNIPPGWSVFCDTGVGVDSCSTSYAILDASCPVGGGAQQVQTLSAWNSNTNNNTGRMRKIPGAQWLYIAEFQHWGGGTPAGFVPSVTPPYEINSTYRFQGALQIRQTVANSAPLSAHPATPIYHKFGVWHYGQRAYPLAQVDPEVLPIGEPVDQPRQAVVQKVGALNPWRVPAYQPIRGPFRDGLTQLDRPMKESKQQKVLASDGHTRPASSSSSAVRRPPNRKTTKEVKLRPGTHMAAKVFGALTEFSDLLHALRGALPKKLRGRPHTLQDEFGIVWSNFDKIDWKEALINALTNELEDRIFGQLGQVGKRASSKLGRPVGVNTGPADDLIKGAKPPKGAKPDEIKAAVRFAVEHSGLF